MLQHDLNWPAYNNMEDCHTFSQLRDFRCNYETSGAVTWSWRPTLHPATDASSTTLLVPRTVGVVLALGIRELAHRARVGDHKKTGHWPGFGTVQSNTNVHMSAIATVPFSTCSIHVYEGQLSAESPTRTILQFQLNHVPF